ncbi:DNA-directed RNA polymerases I [Saitoella complicata NRRL Y-17804]|nr:DNA-directed RNA polymerases I [Saitoella complicata NRRL Y-17804]ODQ51461.1 DNA-directed RNA polymerases I [Saitoella complicata NRRL Y-17804]
MSGSAIILEKDFLISATDNANFDRVTRISASTADKDIEIELDINSEIYPLEEGRKVRLVLAKALALDGSRDVNAEGRGWRETSEVTLAEEYEYVCYGKVYRHDEHGETDLISVYISFGGLLLMVKGNYKDLQGLNQDNVYLLIKKHEQ